MAGYKAKQMAWKDRERKGRQQEGDREKPGERMEQTEKVREAQGIRPGGHQGHHLEYTWSLAGFFNNVKGYYLKRVQVDSRWTPGGPLMESIRKHGSVSQAQFGIIIVAKLHTCALILCIQ